MRQRKESLECFANLAIAHLFKNYICLVIIYNLYYFVLYSFLYFSLSHFFCTYMHVVWIMILHHENTFFMQQQISTLRILQLNLAISNSVNLKSALFRRKIECPWIYTSPLRFLGYFEALLFWTFFHFPWDFEIAGFDCMSFLTFFCFTYL